MPKKEAPLQQLNDFLPPGTYKAVSEYLHFYKIHLTITRQRKSILGDYRHQTASRNHRISINGNLNSFAFLITLLHEIAHLLAFEEYGKKIASHGKEWKLVYTCASGLTITVCCFSSWSSAMDYDMDHPVYTNVCP